MNQSFLKVSQIFIPDGQRGICTVDFAVTNGRIPKKLRNLIGGELGQMGASGLIKHHSIGRQSLSVTVKGKDMPEEVMQVCFGAFGDTFLLEHRPDHDPQSAHRPTPASASYLVSKAGGRYVRKTSPDLIEREFSEFVLA